MKRNRLAAYAAVLCALAASLAFAVSLAAADTGNEVVEAAGGRGFPPITSAASPEEYEQQVDFEGLDPIHTIEQIGPEEIVVKDSEGDTVEWFHLEPAHDAVGANVPTSLRLDGKEVILTVQHHEGNPAAGGAPFTYPIVSGKGWEGGFFTGIVEMPSPVPIETAPSSAPAPIVPTCRVPALRGFGLPTVKRLLLGSDCGVGGVHLARGATRGKGKVVKQVRAAGTELTAGTPVAIKLGGR
jgi:hypothetical protein